MAAAFAAAAWIIAPGRSIAQEAGGKVNPQAARLHAFTARVDEYLALEKKLQTGLPQVQPSDPLQPSSSIARNWRSGSGTPGKARGRGTCLAIRSRS